MGIGPARSMAIGVERLHFKNITAGVVVMRVFYCMLLISVRKRGQGLGLSRNMVVLGEPGADKIR